ncbi:hypothetical protein [Planctobacterium marinum]
MFIFTAGKVQKLATRDTLNSKNRISRFSLPIVLIGREHYQEFEKEYPVPDQNDVRNIINNEYTQLKMVHLHNNALTSTTVKFFLFDKTAEEYVRNNLCLFIPETMLATFVNMGELVTVSRLGNTLNIARKGENIVSSNGAGLYADPDMFLLSSGVGKVAQRKKLTQEEYFAILQQQVTEIPKHYLVSLMKGQVLANELLKRFHFPSVAAGLTCSVLLYWLMLFGHLKWHESFSQSNIESAEVREVIQLKKQLAEKIALADEIKSSASSDLSGQLMWNIITGLLDNGVSVGGLLYQDGEAGITVLTPSATETIKQIRSFPGVRNVSMDGDITSLQGKQSVRLLVAIDSGVNNV